MHGEGLVSLRDIPGYEGVYAVTKAGRVWSHRNRLWLRPQANTHGYFTVNLRRPGHRKQAPIHRLVALAWVPNPHRLPAVNHINGSKPDNRARNLEWCTLGDNVRHAFRTGLALTPAFYAAVTRNAAKARAAKRRAAS